MEPKPLHVYVVSVCVAWAVVLFFGALYDGGAYFKTLAKLCEGFGVGMLAMYIAMHIYRWK